MKKIVMGMLVAVVCLGLAVGASCITSHEFRDVVELTRLHMQPLQFNTTLKIRGGPILVAIGKMVIKRALAENPELTEMLQALHTFQVGIYEIEQQARTAKTRRIPPEAEQFLKDSGWEVVVRVRDHETLVSLLYKQMNDRLVGVYAVVFTGEQLLVVEVQGRLDDFMETVFQHLEPTDNL